MRIHENASIAKEQDVATGDGGVLAALVNAVEVHNDTLLDMDEAIVQLIETVKELKVSASLEDTVYIYTGQNVKEGMNDVVNARPKT